MGKIKAKTHLEKMGFKDPDRQETSHKVIQEWVYKNIDKVIAETVMAKNTKPYKIIQNKWEHEIIHVSGNYKALIGFIDLLAVIDGTFWFKDLNDYENMNRKVFIEVKSKIPDLGELFRQMNSYRAYENRDTLYVIVSPDDEKEQIIREQGFYFYKYKDPNLLF